jgi:hypothetical protein
VLDEQDRRRGRGLVQTARYLHFYVWLGLIALKRHLKGSQAPGTLGCT